MPILPNLVSKSYLKDISLNPVDFSGTESHLLTLQELYLLKDTSENIQPSLRCFPLSCPSQAQKQAGEWPNPSAEPGP